MGKTSPPKSGNSLGGHYDVAIGWMFSNFAWKYAAAVRAFSSGISCGSSSSSAIFSATSSGAAPISSLPVTASSELLYSTNAYMNLAEAWGGGIPKLIQAMSEYGLCEPEFIDMEVAFRINLY